MKQTISITLSKEELQELIRDEIAGAVTTAHKQIEETEELLNQEQATQLLGISRVGLWKWRKAGKIPYYKINNRVYFRKSEILAAMKRVDLSKYNGGTEDGK